ncbi:MAG: hypothetical protein CFH27_00139 [Alphaproteobacteria bacterium MarineAlpha6_Bin5]|jgi:hypothetical protein|nr:MAG: hypothetical protein CFH27_00139 [Alphaproteobacteria bacterium MarineAlpha6_Bin5]|tara:strand:- start:1361 stop:1756 length:396 start_codon:yes stop_codon:yes gene_type:complete
MNKFIHILLFFIFIFFITKNAFSEYIPNIIGTWKGINKSYSEEKGYRTWEKKITITEQNERIFKGNFTYADGEKNFLGTIRSNNRNFYWVSPESKGYIHGEILNINKIEVCYTEAYRGAAVGCSILKRLKD